MKKFALTLLSVVISMSVQAYDYPYLAFQASDGTVTTVSVESLTITVDSSGQLVVTNGDGSQIFTVSDLSKMYFTASSSTDIGSIDAADDDNCCEIYDMLGRKIVSDQLKSGVYIIKTKSGTRKVNVR